VLPDDVTGGTRALGIKLFSCHWLIIQSRALWLGDFSRPGVPVGRLSPIANPVAESGNDVIM
jgi:hypothetical protein